MSDQQTPDVATLMRDLVNAANALDKGSTRLGKATAELDGCVNEETGEFVPGPALRYAERIGELTDEILEELEQDEKRIPAKEVIASRADRRLKVRDPELWADYHRLTSEISNLQSWMTSKKQVISARQSVLSAEKALLGPIPRRDAYEGQMG